MRNIPAILSRDDFFLGLNCALPINQWLFVRAGSKSPGTVALAAYAAGGSSRPLFAAQEYSVAYFGFEARETMLRFIEKYNNFEVTVDARRKYYLNVCQALNQAMPSAIAPPASTARETKATSLVAAQSEAALEEGDDFKYFCEHELNKKVERLLPLEKQLVLQREKKLAEQQ